MQQLTQMPSKSLIFKSIKNFNALWGPYHERPIVDRVVSTSQWPVPYYQRLFHAYPIREKAKDSLLVGGTEIDDANWYKTKELLRKSFKGRSVVQWVENNLKTSSYIIRKDDVSGMSKTYVDDLCHYLDVANKENRRILDKYDVLI